MQNIFPLKWKNGETSVPKLQVAVYCDVGNVIE